MASRYCKACGQWHDLDEDWPDACYGHFRAYRQARSTHIIKDIEPYQAMGTDIATGSVPKIGSRREHREYLKRNGYVEVGNEPIRKPPEIEIADSRPDIARTIHQMKESGRWK